MKKTQRFMPELSFHINTNKCPICQKTKQNTNHMKLKSRFFFEAGANGTQCTYSCVCL